MDHMKANPTIALLITVALLVGPAQAEESKAGERAEESGPSVREQLKAQGLPPLDKIGRIHERNVNEITIGARRYTLAATSTVKRFGQESDGQLIDVGEGDVVALILEQDEESAGQINKIWLLPEQMAPPAH